MTSTSSAVSIVFSDTRERGREYDDDDDKSSPSWDNSSSGISFSDRNYYYCVEGKGEFEGDE